MSLTGSLSLLWRCTTWLVVASVYVDSDEGMSIVGSRKGYTLVLVSQSCVPMWFMNCGLIMCNDALWMDCHRKRVASQKSPLFSD